MASPDTIQSGDVWTAGYTIQAAIGQLYNAFSPVQMAKYTAMIANGGRNLDVTIIKVFSLVFLDFKDMKLGNEYKIIIIIFINRT